MIVFYGEDFELNLTGTKITLIEENPLFYNYFVKNYSWPFSKKIDDETSKKLGFLELENIYISTTKHKGNLMIDSDFKEAYLIINSFKNGVLQGNIFYGENGLALLDTPLSELPFSVVKTDSLIDHAAEVIEKEYPEVNYNFPMVIDPEIRSKTNYSKFNGIINNFENDEFVTNEFITENGEEIAYNYNIVTPFPYLNTILKTGFDSAGIKMQGSFVSDFSNNKILVYTPKFLERFYSGLPDTFQFSTVTEVWLDGSVYGHFTKTNTLNQIGSYKVDLFLNIPDNLTVDIMQVNFKGNTLFSTKEHTIKTVLNLNLQSTDDYGDLEFILNIRKRTLNPADAIGSISNYNKFDFSFSDGELNIYPDVFSLSEIMPDITFGKFLNKIKNWLNLEVIYKKNVVEINYIESKFLDINFKDESHLEIENPSIEFSKNKLYLLKSFNTSYYISKNGIVDNRFGFRDEDITTIDTDIDVMPVQSKNQVFTAYKTPDSNDFKIMLYNGKVNGLPVTQEKVSGRGFSLAEVYDRYWKKWLFFRLNSTRVKDKFRVNILEEFNINSGRFKYNKKHIYKKIKKRRVLEDFWEVDIESETLP